jgi:pyruvate/2-oxoglutarate dehydrogenase complex dihydrolipoamide acyltransferase (E2) component
MLYLLVLKNTIDSGKELRVLEWHKKEGDLCAQGILLVELESYKAVIEIRVAHEAFLRKILVPVGERQALGKPIAVLSDSLDEEIPRSFATLQEMAVEYLFM